MTPYRLLPSLLLLTLLLAARPGGAVAQCPGCGQGAPAGCPGGCVEEEDRGLPADRCAEPGGCVRRKGEPCGVYTPFCAQGLKCQPPEKDEAPLRALLLGRGRCQRPRAPTGEKLKESKLHGATHAHEGNRRDQERNPGTSTTPVRPSPGQDTEMGPCRKHLESVLQQLQTEVFRGTHTLYMPNCDHRGFYRKRQCRSSQGQRKGPCWCVDRMGQPLQGSQESNGSSSCPMGSSG
ncbi:PREDICTED: insulin-like growth factor-binding protein 6 [Elephantulus edwardii]|uniref:insulin-like growth factor-binding protein 6 n=1 Tax=Elephantulus edwardii TaxID=28737 RepID=UPI0003F07FC9|nr:PREDICTED: insulin-like growth factor-binding protein 6 [Elephantulus edwardii]